MSFESVKVKSVSGEDMHFVDLQIKQHVMHRLLYYSKMD